ncbi:hypothetical protein GCM10008957_35140 [Deinococcus ruber]|uniref:Uncharacterized protein n=1 Tax=Deinococcus ruber TaxID=1848197 RepID=A0A918CDH2_9DEIO|nr:hypothetical protein GCM10008957_35140 [Deinococcus ruber]
MFQTLTTAGSCPDKKPEPLKVPVVPSEKDDEASGGRVNDAPGPFSFQCFARPKLPAAHRRSPAAAVARPMTLASIAAA